MTHFRVPAASVLTLLLVAANLLSQTVSPREKDRFESGFTPAGQLTDAELEVFQVPLGSTLPCASFQPAALANYLLSWSGLWQQGKPCDAPDVAKKACAACPTDLSAKHALVVSQVVKAIGGSANGNGARRTVSVTCEVSCGGLLKALEACCSPLKVVSTPITPAQTCVECAKTMCVTEAAACCKDAAKVVSTASAAKVGCACGQSCACAPKTCKCGTDCSCKEADKKAQKRAARRAAQVPFFNLPLHLEGDSPLPRGPMPLFVPGRPMPPLAPQTFFLPNGCPEDANVFLNNPWLAPMPMPTARFAPILPHPPISCDEVMCIEPCPGIQQTRFMSAPATRARARVEVEMSGLEVQCDRLIRTADGLIVCEGNACMTLRRENHPSKIRADRIVLNPGNGSFAVTSGDCDLDMPIPRP